MSMSGLQFGIVCAVDEKAAKVKLLLPAFDNLETHWLPIAVRKSQDDKDYWLPDIGEQLAVIFDEHGEDGVVLGAIYSDADKPPVASKDKWHKTFKDGAVIEYDRNTGILMVSGVKQVQISAEQANITATKASVTAETTITGATTVVGQLTVQGGIKATSPVLAPNFVKG